MKTISRQIGFVVKTLAADTRKLAKTWQQAADGDGETGPVRKKAVKGVQQMKHHTEPLRIAGMALTKFKPEEYGSLDRDTEIAVAVYVLNRMLEFGCPSSVRIV